MAFREAGISDVQAAPIFRAFTADYYVLTIGYIAMQYFEGTECDINDIKLIAKAVEVMVTLRAPSTATLGYIGGGKISTCGRLFWLASCANYRFDQDFCDHILRSRSIDFQGDISAHSRFLCPSDFDPSIFRKHATQDGQPAVVVMEFRTTCFMPLPFIEVALKKDRDAFRRSLIERIVCLYEQSDDAEVLLPASGRPV